MTTQAGRTRRRRPGRLIQLVGSLAVCLVLTTATPAGAAGTLDQSQTSTDAGTECVCTPATGLAQTFTAGITGNLDQVDLVLYRIGDTGDLTVEIRTLSGGVPSSTALANATVPQASVTPYEAWVTVPFSTPAAVTSGSQYALVVSAAGVRCGGPCTSLYGWGAALANPYPGGTAVTSVDGGTSWIELIGLDGRSLDRTFKTYVTPPAIAVSIDVKPGSTQNPLNLRGGGVVPVAILSTNSFDATNVDPDTVCFGDAGRAAERDCTEAHGKGHVEDVSGDRRPDLLLHYEVEETGIDAGDTSACLTGRTQAGNRIEGCDVIETH